MTARARARRLPARRRRRRLVLAALIGGVAYAIGRRRKGAVAPTTPPPVAPPRDEFVSPADSEENRIEALTKLKALRDEGVLTQEQYESERERLTQGIR